MPPHVLGWAVLHCAAGFGDSHLCWGKITDMSLVDKIMLRPLKPKANPRDMTFLADFVYFNMTLV